MPDAADAKMTESTPIPPHPIDRLSLIVGVGTAVIIVLLSLWMATSLLNLLDLSGSNNSTAQAATASAPQSSKAKPVAQAAPTLAAALSSAGPKPAATTPPATPLAAVPKIATPGFFLAAAPGVNIQATEEKPVLEGQQVERITASSNSKDSLNRHYLAMQIVGLSPNKTYRLIAWIKATPGVNVALQGRDHPDSNHPPHNGIGLFAPTKNQVLETMMHVDGSGVLNGPDDWKKVWIDLPTSDGKFMLVLFLLDGTDYTFNGNTSHQIIFGGFELSPRPEADLRDTP